MEQDLKIIVVAHNESKFVLDNFEKVAKDNFENIYMCLDNSSLELDWGCQKVFTNHQHGKVNFYLSVHSAIDSIPKDKLPRWLYIMPIDMIPVPGFYEECLKTCMKAEKEYGTEWIASAAFLYHTWHTHDLIKEIRCHPVDRFDKWLEKDGKKDLVSEGIKVTSYLLHSPLMCSYSFWVRSRGYWGLRGFDGKTSGPFDILFSKHPMATRRLAFLGLAVYHLPSYWCKNCVNGPPATPCKHEVEL